MVRIGVIGYGGRIQGVIAQMRRLDAAATVVAVTDVRDRESIVRELTATSDDPSAVRFYTNADEMLDTEELNGIMIGTRCSLHTPMAIKVFERNLPLFLEKPVATNMQDLLKLRDAADKTLSEVVVSFPLRVTPLVQLAKEIVDSGKIGTVEHVQAWNNVPYGRIYYQYWYRDENETQGLFVQKATHDFDYINYLLGIEPKALCAMTSKQIYKGDRPAGLRCEDCDEWDSCLDSPFHTYFSKHESERVEPFYLFNMCGFAEDTGNEDSGSALIRYETGMHACYSQNFFARKSAGKRGARLLGYKGTIEFDWFTDELKVFMHHTPRVETYKAESRNLPHYGGDVVLADSFLRIIKNGEESVSPLSAGLLSALMCLKAKESAMTQTFQQIKWPPTG